MKKNKRIFMILIINLGIFSLSMYGLSYGNQKKLVKYENAILAVTIDGEQVIEIPQKGVYQVDVNCQNATGKWNYDDWTLELENVKENSSCAIEFNSLNNNYLNKYISSLAGNGSVVDEKIFLPTKNASYVKTDMNYTLISGTSLIKNNMIYSNSGTTTNQKTVSKFVPNENGYYRICYNIPSSSAGYGNSNYIYLKQLNNTTTNYKLINSNYSSGLDINDCFEYGYISTADYLYIETNYYDKTLDFWFEKANSYEAVSTGIRYEGKNPNNYVKFNNELWRIIGVFDDSTHGVENKKLVKLIKQTKIGIATSSAVPTSTLDSYYKNINDYYRGMVSLANWHNGGTDLTETAEGYYKAERNLVTIKESNKDITSSYISLMYISDYGFASLSTDCDRSTRVSSYDTQKCAGLNWLFRYNGDMTLTNQVGRSGLLQITYSGGVSSFGSGYDDYVISPVIYLSDQVKLLDGNGSYDDPYIITI